MALAHKGCKVITVIKHQSRNSALKKEKTPKQSGLEIDYSKRSPPEYIQLMKKMDHRSNANNENKSFALIKDEYVTIQLIWKELKANRKE